MRRYLVRRVIQMVPVLVGISVVVFLVMRLLPGDVAAMILMGPEGEAGVREADLIALRQKLGLNDPYLVQYVRWIKEMVLLKGGESLWSGVPVFQEIGQRLPLTVELAGLSLAFSLVIALSSGILSAVWQDTPLDYLLRGLSMVGLSIPNFWLGTLIILALSRLFFWSPPLGYTDFFTDPWTNLQQVIWPVVVLGSSLAAVTSRMTRSAMLEVLREDYIRTARAKGLSGEKVVVRHALRNALLPVITLSAVQLGHLLSGTVIVEMIFTLPGVGRYLVDSIFHRDYPAIQALVTLIAVLFVLLNLLVDLLYAVIDPRIRYS
ncbi:MAG: ABC transporter permease [Nitrospinota bacterium]|nr:MAG: ABC transporter permease [Nitrospinota bacterium]